MKSAKLRPIELSKELRPSPLCCEAVTPSRNALTTLVDVSFPSAVSTGHRWVEFAH